MGSDISDKSMCPAMPAFQSTLPVWGATLYYAEDDRASLEFQSTLPVWGATMVIALVLALLWVFQSTLPVWGATALRRRSEPRLRFQSTLPVWGATGNEGRVGADRLFQSTLPVWGATERNGWKTRARHVSIHAPRVGSDDRRPDSVGSCN